MPPQPPTDGGDPGRAPGSEFMALLNESMGPIRDLRGAVYGDPYENHAGLACMWTALLQPHWRAIRDGHPIPAHVAALLMVGLKLDRMRTVFHADNYVDLGVYAALAYDMQKAHRVPEWPRLPTHRPINVYVAGPFTAPNDAGVRTHIEIALRAGHIIMAMGHNAIVPHGLTAGWDGALERSDFLRLDGELIRLAADVLWKLWPSPGADWEEAHARRHGVPVVSGVSRGLTDLLGRLTADRIQVILPADFHRRAADFCEWAERRYAEVAAEASHAQSERVPNAGDHDHGSGGCSAGGDHGLADAGCRPHHGSRPSPAHTTDDHGHQCVATGAGCSPRRTDDCGAAAPAGSGLAEQAHRPAGDSAGDCAPDRRPIGGPP